MAFKAQREEWREERREECREGAAWHHVGSPQPPGVIPEHHQTWQQNQKEKINTKSKKGETGGGLWGWWRPVVQVLGFGGDTGTCGGHREARTRPGRTQAQDLGGGLTPLNESTSQAQERGAEKLRGKEAQEAAEPEKRPGKRPLCPVGPLAVRGARW